ncbi:hypothetical protein [Yoonia sp. BS5-3]|uniref:Restriction endonuclease n=1 Tax=Yoonia phaeophyticola TaxID=3137369 RepID=A0ABZ2UYV8_9RHOB
MRVSQFFKLKRNQASLPFIDVDVVDDVRLFLNAKAIRALDTDWGDWCEYLISNFFDHVISSIKAGNSDAALLSLEQLREPRETHLGMSATGASGRGLGKEKARSLWASLKQSQAVKSGLLTDLEDTALLIEGVSVDIISDIITNIIREPLIDFTNQVCEEYGIPIQKQVNSGPLWNPEAKEWVVKFADFPMANDEKLLLVPKSIVRIQGDYDVSNYYRHYILEDLKQKELVAGSALVRTLKTGKNKGTRKVFIKDLQKKYGKEKKVVSIRETLKNPSLLMKYKVENSEPTPPLTHAQLADSQGTARPDWDKMLHAVLDLDVGKKKAYQYEDAIFDLTNALFYPSLTDPEKQTPLHEGLKRVDITYYNYANEGFFSWLGKHYSAPMIFLECKNYGSEIGNPEIDQIAMRFSAKRGQFGIVFCRNVEKQDRLLERCKAAANDGHGYVVVIDDARLVELVDEVKSEGALFRGQYTVLKDEFGKLIL